MSDPAPPYATRAAFDRARMTTSVSTPAHARQSNEANPGARAPLQPRALAMPDPRPSFARPAQIPRSDMLEPWADLSAFEVSRDKDSFQAMRREMHALAQVQRQKTKGR